jgi:hypothetical protein
LAIAIEENKEISNVSWRTAKSIERLQKGTSTHYSVNLKKKNPDENRATASHT